MKEKHVQKSKKASRFRKVLIPIAIAVIAIMAISGGAFAAYNFWQGQASVTVVEGMTVTKTGMSGGSWDDGTNTWTISTLKAGEVRTITFDVTNTATSGKVTVIPTVTPSSWSGFTLGWSGAIDGGGTDIWAGDTKNSTLTITALGDIVPGSYSFTIIYQRQ